eukprot:6605212-Lingulodinium_polyedra.AAC.1
MVRAAAGVTVGAAHGPVCPPGRSQSPGHELPAPGVAEHDDDGPASGGGPHVQLARRDARPSGNGALESAAGWRRALGRDGRGHAAQ